MHLRARFTGAYPEPLTYLAGYAGTGKSTMLPFLLDDIDPSSIAFVAPTGKAAKVMSKKLAAQKYPNPFARTIHSTMYRAKPVPIHEIEAECAEAEARFNDLKLLGRGDTHEAQTFRRTFNRLTKELDQLYVSEDIVFQMNPDSILADKKLIVADEGSMIGSIVSRDLMSWGVPILVMGDPGQLPPVKDEAGLTAGKPDYFLTEIHRQAQDNPILQLATMARQGKTIRPGVYGDGRARVMSRKDFSDTFDWDAPPPKFLCGTNKTRWRQTTMMRENYEIIPADKKFHGPREGEPLMVKKNNKQYPALTNGTECVATSTPVVTPGHASFKMSFEDDEGVRYNDVEVFQGLFEEHRTGIVGDWTAGKKTGSKVRNRTINADFGWVSTVHSSQGSQWDHVVVTDESSVFRDDAAKHAYTAYTRAAETLTVII